MDGRIWPQWKEIHPLANVELINAFHKAREYDSVLSKIYFTAFLRIENLLWPSPVTMNVPEKFFHSRGMEIYSMLCGSSNFVSSADIVNCLKQQISGRWLVDSFVHLCWYCLWGHRSVSYSLHQGNGARNILSIGPTPLAAHQSRKAGIQLCSFSWRNTFPVWQSGMESEWGHLISCSTHSFQTNVVAQQNTWQHIQSVSLEASLKGGKNEAGLNQLKCFECWRMYSQRYWYLDHKLCLQSKKEYKEMIWPKSLLVWFYWLSK